MCARKRDRTGVEEVSGSSESSESSASRRRERKRHKKKKAKKEKRERKRDRKKEKRRRAAEEEGSEQPLPPTVWAGVADGPPAEAEPAAPAAAPAKVVAGAMRPEEAAVAQEAAQRVTRVFDPSLGVWRMVRSGGEVLESCVSRQEQRQLMAAKARTVQPSVSAAPSVGPQGPESYTGRDKFPSQHPWFGDK